MKVDVAFTPRPFMEPTEDFASPAIRVRGKGGGPPMVTCKHCVFQWHVIVVRSLKYSFQVLMEFFVL